MIIVGGMIGLGKSSVAKVLGAHFKSDVFYEGVDDNPILPLFYTETEEVIQKNRYPFLLQLHFLNSKFRSIKNAAENNKNILDRSIYEDYYFAKKNLELGRISNLEMGIYEDILNNMLHTINGDKQKDDIMIYLKGSFETVLNRIALRGRTFEVSDSLKEYFHFLWKDYDKFIKTYYEDKNIIVIDMDKIDIINNEKDKEILIKLVEEKYNSRI